MSEYLMTLKMIGSNAGKETPVSGLTDNKGNLRKLGVWVTDWNVAAIKVWLDAGEPVQMGQPKGDYKEIIFGPNDRLVSAMLADNGSRDSANLRLGSIRLVFANREPFHACMRKPFGTEQSIDVGSGVLVGVNVRSGADIDALGLLLFKPWKTSVIRDVVYEDLSYWKDQIRVSSVDSFSDRNDDDAPSNWEFEGSWTKSLSSSWSTTAGYEMTFGARVEAGVPEIVTVEASFEFKVSKSFSHETTIVDEVTHRWSKSGVLVPGDSVSLEAIVGTAQITPRFAGKLEITFDSGAKLVRPVIGDYAGVSASKVVLKTADGRIVFAEADAQHRRRVVPAPESTAVA